MTAFEKDESPSRVALHRSPYFDAEFFMRDASINGGPNKRRSANASNLLTTRAQMRLLLRR
jgi:hypothetical protein